MDGISLYDNHIGYTEVEIADIDGDCVGDVVDVDPDDIMGHHLQHQHVEISDPIAVELPLETVETTIVSAFNHGISPPMDGKGIVTM